MSDLRSHHEGLDGSGYPDGLRGNEFPQEARIIAVADVYDALTSRRAYRDALSLTAALAMIAADIRLDARCVAVLPAALAHITARTGQQWADIATVTIPAPPQSIAAD